MPIHLYNAAVQTAGGPEPALVVVFDSPSFKTGLFGFIMSDFLGDSAEALIFGRTLGVHEGVIRTGPLLLTSAYGRGRIVLDDGDGVSVVAEEGVMDADRSKPGIDIPFLVGLFAVLPATTPLPLPHAPASCAAGVAS